MEKVYILTGTSGKWDTYINFNIGVYSSVEIAEIELNNIINIISEFRNEYTDEEIKKFESESRNLPFDIEDENINSDLSKYLNWACSDYLDYNLDSFEIKEYTINKIQWHF